MQVELAINLEDIVIYGIAAVYAIIVMTVADLSRRKLNLGSDFTRKIVHLFAGAAVWTVPYYPHPWVATLVALTFAIMLGLMNSDRFGRFFEAMARPEDLEHGSVRGPFWYAVSITILTGIFTLTGNDATYFIPAAAIHIMMLGDGMSAPIGIKYGKNHTRTILGSKRSLQGSLALFLFGFLGVLVAFWWFGIYSTQALVGPGGIMMYEIIILALVGSLTATLVELVSPKGTDNILLPFVTTAVMLLVGMQLGVVAF
ncbi:MAG: diacylglycerol/polyprenol kinase family protein [Candidatus Thorarchaeota archaeon]